jgi:hypothetical protein
MAGHVADASFEEKQAMPAPDHLRMHRDRQDTLTNVMIEIVEFTQPDFPDR